jgi:hypothetical protein
MDRHLGLASQERLRRRSANVQARSLGFRQVISGSRRNCIVFEKVTVAYRGAGYEIGRGRDFYGIWTAGGSRSQPLQRWPETPDGWSAAWSRFTEMEQPGTIVPAGRTTVPPPRYAPPPGGHTPAPEEGTSQDIVTLGGNDDPGASNAGWRPSLPAAGLRGGRRGAISAAALLAAGVALGVAGLFPDYLTGASLAQAPPQLIPHAIYLAVWTAGAALILLGGSRLRAGALLAGGMSAVTFGLYLADAGTPIAGGAHLAGLGMALTIAGWIACAAGSVIALLIRPAASKSPAAPRRLGMPRGAALGPAIMLVVAGIGAAITFAPAWDSYTLRTSSGQTQYLTAGNAFSNPGAVIAGDVLVMVALAAVVIAAALWRPARHGAVLLAGAAIPMVAQAISAVVQVSETTPAQQFGLTPAQASQLGLTISNGLTPAFWVYSAFVLALAVSCLWMLSAPQAPIPVQAAPAQPAQPAGPAGPPASGAAAQDEDRTWSPDTYGWYPATPDGTGASRAPASAGRDTDTLPAPGVPADRARPDDEQDS